MINKDFLQHAKFGKVGRFAGQLTDLNIWSTILDGSDIRDLYLCQVLEKPPDIVDWQSSNVISGKYIVVSEETAHPCEKKTESGLTVYDVTIAMEPAKNILRVCAALGGTMEPPSSKADLEIIKEKVRKGCKGYCNRMWIPIFKRTEEDWIDEKDEVALYLPWRKGQPNGGNYEMCAWMSVSSLYYYDASCADENMFYCEIKDFQACN